MQRSDLETRVSAKSKLGQMIYWSACGVGAITLAAGLLAAFRSGEVDPLLVTFTFGIGAWLVGRSARDLLGRKEAAKTLHTRPTDD
jgi:hypothetical protein